MIPLRSAAVIVATACFIAPAAAAIAGPEPAATSRVAAPPSGPRYLMWYAIDGDPTPAQLEYAAHRCAVVVLNVDDVAAAQRLRALDPDVLLLAYMDLSSVRTYDRETPVASGVSHDRARSSGWLARDGSGHEIPWSYAGHVQAAVWDGGYQNAWADRAVQVATSGPWDGILADNDMSTLRHYSSALLSGTSTSAETDGRIRAGLDGLVKVAGERLAASGKMLVPNVSDGRLDVGRWRDHTSRSGGMDENFMSWSGQTSGVSVWDWGDSGWSTIVSEVASGPRTFALTTAAPWDTRTQIYGYASFLLGASPGDAWQAKTPGSLVPPLPIETSWDIGAPTTSVVRSGATYSRTFERAWVVVNPSTAEQRVQAPASYAGSDGRPLGEIVLPAMSAVIGHR